MEPVDLEYPSLQVWRVETDLTITRRNPTPRPPKIVIDLADGQNNGGYTLIISRDYGIIYGGGLDPLPRVCRMDHVPLREEFQDRLAQAQPWHMDLEVNQSEVIRDNKNNLDVVRFTRLS